MAEFEPEELISIADLSKRLGIPAFHIQRAIPLGLFQYAQNPTNGSRYVLANDGYTLELLDCAAELFKSPDNRLKFADAIRMAKLLVRQSA